MIIPISARGASSPKHALFCQVSKLMKAGFLLCDTEFMNTCSITIHFKKISVVLRCLLSN